MRRRILGVAVLAIVLAVTLFGVPLAVAVNRLFYGDERGELERLALRGAVAVSLDTPVSADPVELPKTEPSVELGIYDRSGRRLSGTGPASADPAVRSALRGNVSDVPTATDLVVAVPVSSGERVIAVSRAASPRDTVRSRVRATWAGMLGLAAVAGACAALIAAAQARRLTRPLERLEAVAEDIGAGNFVSRTQTSGVGEIDRAGQALNRTAERLDDLLARERAFSARASHQLRTPVTGLRLVLDTALSTPGADLRAAAAEAIGVVDRLSRTIDDVLLLSRGSGPPAEVVDVGAVLEDLRLRWHGTLAAAGRPLSIEQEEPTQVLAAAPAVRQILDVLLDNAYRHGQGRVGVRARAHDAAVAVDVTDEGSTTGRSLLVSEGAAESAVGGDEPGRRLGLPLASSLAQAQGGRLLHARTEARTRLTLLLPAAPPERPPGAATECPVP